MIELTEKISGLSLGQAGQSTAFVYLKATRKQEHISFFVSYLKRWPAGTSLRAIMDNLRYIYDNMLPNTTLIVDRNETGDPVMELISNGRLNADVRFYRVSQGKGSGEENRVPRADLGDTIRLARDWERIEFADDLDSREATLSACRGWQIKSLSKGDDLWQREGPDDDIMISLALPMWYAEKQYHWLGSETGSVRGPKLSPHPRGVFHDYGTGW